MNDRLYRSVDDRVLAGVCAGLADRLDLDPALVRIGYAILDLVTGIFPMLVLYVIMVVVIPEEPTWAGVRPVGPQAPGGVPGWPTGNAAGPVADQPAPPMAGDPAAPLGAPAASADPPRAGRGARLGRPRRRRPAGTRGAGASNGPPPGLPATPTAPPVGPPDATTRSWP